jgi:hypothetical protein
MNLSVSALFVFAEMTVLILVKSSGIFEACADRHSALRF